MMKKILALAVAGLLPLAALAQVTVAGAWVRATVPHQASAGVYLQLRSQQDARLVEVKTPAAARAEMHRMQMEGQTMTMRAVPAIALPAGQPVDLAGGGYHLMLFGLKQQLKEGGSVPLTLVVEDARHRRTEVQVAVPVRPLTFVPPAR